ncbi:unnamed protein product [Arctogadus glacialis]
MHFLVSRVVGCFKNDGPPGDDDLFMCAWASAEVGLCDSLHVFNRTCDFFLVRVSFRLSLCPSKNKKPLESGGRVWG